MTLHHGVSKQSMLLGNGLLVSSGFSSLDASTHNKYEHDAMNLRVTRWRRCLRHWPTRQRVASSTPDVVIAFLNLYTPNVNYSWRTAPL